jgi:hypothetical protein
VSVFSATAIRISLNLNADALDVDFSDTQHKNAKKLDKLQ